MIYLFSIIGIGVVLYGIFLKETFYIGIGLAYMFAVLAVGAKLDDDNIRNKRRK